MRMIHDVIDDLRDWHDEEVTPLGAVLEELLGGERGSLPELGERFTRAGFGHVMASWIGTGPNLPINTGDLRRILGEQRVQELATLAGLASHEFVVRLARLLPAAIRRMTAETGSESPD